MLKKELVNIGINLVKGNFIKKSDIKKIIAETEFKEGIVKWFRKDGTGYIVEKNKPESIYFDSSSIKGDGTSLEKGQKVNFIDETIMGRKVAVEVHPVVSNKILADTPDNLGKRIQKAYDILEKDAQYKKIMTDLKLNADKYFNKYAKQPDSFVEEGEQKEKELVDKAAHRMEELKIKTTKNGMAYFSGNIAEGSNKKTKDILKAALKCVVGDKPFVGDDDDDTFDDLDEKLKDALNFMKSNGLVPKGTGKPTRPSTATDHDVAYDPDLDIHYLIVKNRSTGGDLWLLEDNKKPQFLSSFQGKFKPQPGVKIYKKGRYHDYLAADTIRGILDIVDPNWDEPTSEEEKQYMRSLDRQNLN
jgi:cold shock CspA family protein